MEEITPEQKAYLATFAGQRDAALLEISNLQASIEKLQLLNKNLSSSNTDIQTRIQQAIGRLEELDKKESDYESVVSGSLMENMIKKARLESEVTNLEKIIKVLTPVKESLQKDISSLTGVYNTINSRVGVLDKVVDHVTRVSEKNVDTIEKLVSSVKISMQELVDINKKNVAETDMVVKELPKVFFDVQRKSLIKQKI